MATRTIIIAAVPSSNGSGQTVAIKRSLPVSITPAPMFIRTIPAPPTPPVESDRFQHADQGAGSDDYDENDCANGEYDYDEPYKKRQRLTHLTTDEKLKRRKLRNRIAAQTARDRKKQLMETLESRLGYVEEENASLRKENVRLRQTTEQLVRDNKAMKAELEALKAKSKNEPPSGNPSPATALKSEPAGSLTFEPAEGAGLAAGGIVGQQSGGGGLQTAAGATDGGDRGSGVRKPAGITGDDLDVGIAADPDLLLEVLEELGWEGLSRGSSGGSGAVDQREQPNTVFGSGDHARGSETSTCGSLAGLGMADPEETVGRLTQPSTAPQSPLQQPSGYVELQKHSSSNPSSTLVSSSFSPSSQQFSSASSDTKSSPLILPENFDFEAATGCLNGLVSPTTLFGLVNNFPETNSQQLPTLSAPFSNETNGSTNTAGTRLFTLSDGSFISLEPAAPTTATSPQQQASTTPTKTTIDAFVHNNNGYTATNGHQAPVKTSKWTQHHPNLAPLLLAPPEPTGPFHQSMLSPNLSHEVPTSPLAGTAGLQVSPSSFRMRLMLPLDNGCAEPPLISPSSFLTTPDFKSDPSFGDANMGITLMTSGGDSFGGVQQQRNADDGSADSASFLDPAWEDSFGDLFPTIDV